MKTAILVVTLLAASSTLAAAPESTIGEPDCKVLNPSPATQKKFTWSGACKDGYADGPGTLEWFVGSKLTSHKEGSMTRGALQGEGYIRWADGTQYEGGLRKSTPHGEGIEQLLDKTRYEGGWKNGLKEGAGSIVYANGGSYAGQWKAGRFHGRGKAIYTSGKAIEGQFAYGLRVGQASVAPLSKYQDYSMATEPVDTGTKIKFYDVSGGTVPYRKGWDGMNKDEQRAIRQHYQMLHEGDEPPYPVGGTAQIYQAMAEGQKQVLTDGLLRMNVLVDSSGTPSTVTVYHSPHPEITTVATYVVMQENDKPALCAGTACPMIFPYSVLFEVK